MATQEEILKVILKTQGEADARRLSEEIDRQKQSVLNLSAQYGQLDKATILAASHLRDLETQFNAAQKAAGRAPGAFRDFGSAALQSARALEDLQYGIQGVVNNIPGIVAGLGGGAGLQAAANLAAIGVSILWTNLKKLIPAAGEAAGSVGALKDRIDELEKLGPSRLAVDTLELDQAKKKVEELTNAKKALDALMAAQTADEGKSGKAFGEAIVETPGGREAIEKVKGQFLGELIAADPRLKEFEESKASAQRTLKSTTDEGEYQGALDDIKRAEEKARGRKQELKTQADYQVGGALHVAQHGGGAGQRFQQANIADRIARLGGQGNADLAEQLRGASPEGIAARAETDNAFDKVLEQSNKDDAKIKERRARRDRERKQSDADLARDLVDPAVLAQAQGRGLTGADVLARLKAAKATDAEGRAPRVAELANKLVEEKVQKRTIEGGFASTEEALADIAREAAEKAKEKADAARRKAENTPAAKKKKKEDDELWKLIEGDIAGKAKEDEEFTDRVIGKGPDLRRVKRFRDLADMGLTAAQAQQVQGNELMNLARQDRRFDEIDPATGKKRFNADMASQVSKETLDRATKANDDLGLHNENKESAEGNRILREILREQQEARRDAQKQQRRRGVAILGR